MELGIHSSRTGGGSVVRIPLYAFSPECSQPLSRIEPTFARRLSLEFWAEERPMGRIEVFDNATLVQIFRVEAAYRTASQYEGGGAEGGVGHSPLSIPTADNHFFEKV